MRVSGRHRLFPFIARQSKYGYIEDTTEVIHALASPITRFLLARTRSPRTFLPRSERILCLEILCLEASEYCATKHFVSLARLLLESLNYRPMVTATTWPSSQFNSVHGPISSSIFGRNSRAHHQAMPVKQGESTRLSRRGMKCVRFSSHALPFVPARKRFIRTTQISSMHDLALRFCEICFGLCPLSSIRANLGRISLLGLLLRLPSLTSPLIMFLFASLAPFVVLANAVAANPIVVRDGLVSLPFARYVNASGARDLVRRDQERARRFHKPGNTLASEMSPGIDVTNTGNYYMASVGVGIPATYCGSC